MPTLGLRIGVSVPTAPDLATWRDRARRVQGSGFDALYVPDHRSGAMLAPLPALVAASACTTTLRLGTLVLNVDLWNPVALAREAVTMALVTEGRFELGMGAGNRSSEYDEAGLRFDPPRVRVERLAETILLLRRLWSGEEVIFDGRHHRVAGHRCPVPAAPIPLLIGANGPRLLAVAAEHADVIGFVGVSPSRRGDEIRPTHLTRSGLDAQVANVDTATRDRSQSLRRSILVQQVTLTDDRRSAAEELMPWFPGVTVDDLVDSPYLLLGTVPHIVEQLHELRDRWGITDLAVLGSSLSAMERVLAAV